MIRSVRFDFLDDMTLTNHGHRWDVIQLSKFGGILIGTPSVHTKNDVFGLAVTIRSHEDWPIYKLVYMYYSGNNNSSCIDGESAYQCDVIEESTSPYVIGAPSFQMDEEGNIFGIAYSKYGTGLKYAYPHTRVLG
jgi:hypothetical protein